MPIHPRQASRLAFMLVCTVVESCLSSPVHLREAGWLILL